MEENELQRGAGCSSFPEMPPCHRHKRYWVASECLFCNLPKPIDSTRTQFKPPPKLRATATRNDFAKYGNSDRMLCRKPDVDRREMTAEGTISTA